MSGSDTTSPSRPDPGLEAVEPKPSLDMSDHTSIQWVDVCTLEQLIPNYGVGALVGGQQIAIFLVMSGSEQQLYAIDNYDPISKANVLSRGIVGDLQGELVVASPIYKQHFSLTTGRCLEDDEVCVSTYPVRVSKGGQVQLKVSADEE